MPPTSQALDPRAAELHDFRALGSNTVWLIPQWNDELNLLVVREQWSEKQNQYSSKMMSWHCLGPPIDASSAPLVAWIWGRQIRLGQSLGDQTAPEINADLWGRTQDNRFYSDSPSSEERSPWKTHCMFCHVCHFGKLPNELISSSAILLNQHPEY